MFGERELLQLSRQRFQPFSVSQVQRDAWWEVDLGGAQQIERVVVHNRTDCCQERLQGFTLQLLDKKHKLLWERPANAGSRWKGPYLDEQNPKDPWGGEYQFNYSGGSEFEITSYGADGSPGGSDEATDLSSKTINQETE